MAFCAAHIATSPRPPLSPLPSPLRSGERGREAGSRRLRAAQGGEVRWQAEVCALGNGVFQQRSLCFAQRAYPKLRLQKRERHQEGRPQFAFFSTCMYPRSWNAEILHPRRLAPARCESPSSGASLLLQVRVSLLIPDGNGRARRQGISEDALAISTFHHSL